MVLTKMDKMDCKIKKQILQQVRPLPSWMRLETVSNRNGIYLEGLRAFDLKATSRIWP